MTRVIIKGGLVVDPVSGWAEVGDVVIAGERVAAIGPAAADESSIGEAGAGPDVRDHRGDPGLTLVDAAGQVVVPGLIDAHAHLREPGQEHKEDICSGTAAAARGGFTAVAAMPNTEPVVDSRVELEYVLARAAASGRVRVLPIGAVTKGMKGAELAELGDLADAGAVAFSDDGNPVRSAELMRLALEYARMFGRPVISHCQDDDLFNDGVMHLGYWSSVLGLRGIPAAAEEVQVARDIILSGLTGGHVHLTHLSSAGSVELVRRAKERGLPVTADVTPHHLTLTDESVRRFDYDTNTKVNPPLRTEADREALRRAVQDGVVDLIATDHAPHHLDDKDVEYNYAAFGISGLETAVGLVVTHLVEGGYLDWVGLARTMSLAPARLFGLAGKGSLAVGSDADVTVIDPRVEWTVDPSQFASRGHNTPFRGVRLKGRVTTTIVGGRPILLGGELVI